MAINKPENTAERYAKLKAAETAEMSRETSRETARPMLFNKKNFLFFGIGLLTVVIGFFFMAGGQMPDANTFDESIIYSPMRITVAPFMVLLGLGIIIYGIFKNTDDADPVDLTKEEPR
jgi:hypothetical protein